MLLILVGVSACGAPSGQQVFFNESCSDAGESCSGLPTTPIEDVISKPVAKDDDPKMFFLAENRRYSAQYLQNLLEEKRDIRLQRFYQNEKRQADRALSQAERAVRQQKVVVQDLQQKLGGLKGEAVIAATSAPALRRESEIEKVEKELLAAELELVSREQKRDQAYEFYLKKSDDFADHTAAVKGKVDALLSLERRNDQALADFYETL